MGRSKPMAAGEPGGISVALFDSSTLVGKSVKAQLRARRFPVGRIRAFDTGAVEEGGNLTDFDGQAMLAMRPDADVMEYVDLAFYCGASGTAGPYLDWPGRFGFAAIDLTQTANRKDGTKVVHPEVNPENLRGETGLLAVPHPVSLFLSTLLAPLARTVRVQEAVSVVLQPASEKGDEGIEELYRQTVGVLNFTEVPKEQFGSVLAFNVMPDSAADGGRAGEELVARETAAILGKPFPLTVRLLRGPVFHCHAFYVWLRLSQEASPSAVQQTLAAEKRLRIVEGKAAPTPAELAGREGIHVQIRPDAAVPNSVWLWGVADNLVDGTALSAVRLAEMLLQAGALGKSA